MKFLSDRFKELSTWRALVWCATAFGLVTLSPEQSNAVMAVGMALAGGIGFGPDKLK
ncbi:MAG: hypothetical protein RL563_1091 [Pseudomonadota bacterium]|jgi:hypothetical protein